MDKLRAELHRMRGKCIVRVYATTDSGTRLQDEDIYTGIAEFARSSETRHPCAYHQRCHQNTCFADKMPILRLQHNHER